jgi:hypothetical protein
VYNSTVERLRLLSSVLKDLQTFRRLPTPSAEAVYPPWFTRIETDLYPRAHPEAQNFFPGSSEKDSSARKVLLHPNVGLIIKPYLPTHRLPSLPESGPSAWTWDRIDGAPGGPLLFDGLVFNTALSRYYPGNTVFNPRTGECSKYKPASKQFVDFQVVRAQEEFLRRRFAWAPLFSQERIDWAIEDIVRSELVRGGQTGRATMTAPLAPGAPGEDEEEEECPGPFFPQEEREAAARYGQDLRNVPWAAMTQATEGDLYLFVPVPPSGNHGGGGGGNRRDRVQLQKQATGRSAGPEWNVSNASSLSFSFPFARILASDLARTGTRTVSGGGPTKGEERHHQLESLGVFECKFSNWRKKWIPVQQRTDKKKGNAFTTVLKTLENIHNPISREDLIATCLNAC